MANDRLFSNIGELSGSYNGVPFADTKTSALNVTIPVIEFAKYADQTLWIDGELTIGIKLDNTDGSGVYTNLSLVDIIDATAFNYVDDSVKVTLTHESTTTVLMANTDYIFTISRSTPIAGQDTIQIQFLSTGAASEIALDDVLEITFRGSKVTPQP